MLSVIIPAYNEANNICRTVGDLEKTLRDSGLESEVIIVDDGSLDGTLERAMSFKSTVMNVKAVRYENNMGKGHALKYGFEYTEGDLVLFLDADSDLPPAQIPLFVEYMIKYSADVVVGSKRHPLSDVHYPLSRRMYSRAYGLLTRGLFDLRIADTQVGLKLFRRDVLENVSPKVLVKRYAFDLELLANASRLGYRTVEAPVILSYQLSSRIGFGDIGRIFMDTVAVFYRMRILHYYDRNP